MKNVIVDIVQRSKVKRRSGTLRLAGNVVNFFELAVVRASGDCFTALAMAWNLDSNRFYP